MVSKLIITYSDFRPKWQIHELKLKRSSWLNINTMRKLYSYNCNDRDTYVDKKIITIEFCLSSDHTSEIPFFHTLWQMALSLTAAGSLVFGMIGMFQWNIFILFLND